MNFKNLILSTILLLNIPIILCVEKPLKTLIAECEVAEWNHRIRLIREHEEYLNSRKIPIYSKFYKHEDSITAPDLQLIKAVLSSNLPDTKAALAAGANPDVNYLESSNDRGTAYCSQSEYHYKPALIIAIDNQQWEIAAALIVAGANVNQSALDGTSWNYSHHNSFGFNLCKHRPLTFIVSRLATTDASSMRWNLVKLLLAHGADINLPAITGYGDSMTGVMLHLQSITAIALAEVNHHDEIIKLLREKEPKIALPIICY